MRQTLFAAVATTTLAVAAPAMAQGEDNWSGFYVGGALGGAWGDTSTATSATPGGGPIVIPPADLARIAADGADSDNPSGFTGGLESGYNYVSGSWLFGLETDYSAFDVSQSKSNTFTSGLLIAPPLQLTVTQEISTDWLWTLRGRVGYVSGPWMVYGTGGLAASKVQYDIGFSNTRTPPETASQSFSDTKTGWTVGFGGAYALTPNWSMKGEYLYTDLGDIRGTLNTPNGFVNVTSQSEITANIFRVGVDYRF